jgi:hypothetical protein
MVDPGWIVRRMLLGFVLAVLVIASAVLLALQGGRPVTATDLLPRFAAIECARACRRVDRVPRPLLSVRWRAVVLNLTRSGKF